MQAGLNSSPVRFGVQPVPGAVLRCRVGDRPVAARHPEAKSTDGRFTEQRGVNGASSRALSPAITDGGARKYSWERLDGRAVAGDDRSRGSEGGGGVVAPRAAGQVSTDDLAARSFLGEPTEPTKVNLAASGRQPDRFVRDSDDVPSRHSDAEVTTMV